MDPFTIALLGMQAAGTAGAAYDYNKAKGATKDARRTADSANQMQESQSVLNLLLSQLVPGSAEYEQLLTQGLDLVRNTGNEGDQSAMIQALAGPLLSSLRTRVAGGGPANAFEERTDKAFGELRTKAAFTPEEDAILNALRGTPQTGDGSDIYSIFSGLVDRGADPDSFYSDMFDPKLALVQDSVKNRAAQRGILGSGLELENLGRAGIDLAIKEAEARESYRQKQLDNVTNLYNAGQGLRSREIGLEESRTNMQFEREGNLTGMLAGEGSQRLSDRNAYLGDQTSRSNSLLDQARSIEEQRKQQLSQSASGLGSSLGSSGGFSLPGGSAGTFAPMGGGSSAPISADELLALDQAGYGGRTNQRRNLLDLLSRRGG